jgi:TQXA domain-containing protein
MMPISAQATTNTSELYVGYTGATDSYTPATYPVKYPLTSVYVTPKSNYISGSGPANSSLEEVAYCFNKNGRWPGSSYDGYWHETSTNTTVDGATIYYKVDNATGQEFYDSTTKPRITDPNEFRAKILSIGLNGYPYDFSDFNKDEDGNQILDDYNFRALTQYAIWYYTDSDDTIDEAYMEYKSWTDDEKRIFSELKNTTLPTYITDMASSEIDLYLWDQKPSFGSDATIYYSDGTMRTTGDAGYTDPNYEKTNAGWKKGYQNLLAVHTETASQIKSLVATRTLTISKATKGSLDGNFTFNISLGAGTMYWVNEQTSDKVTDDGNGHLTVTLKKDESVSLRIGGSSFTYNIEETGAADYETSIEIKKGQGTVSATNSKAVSGTNVTEDTVIKYTNSEGPEIPPKKTEIQVVVQDKEGNELPDAEVEVKDSHNVVIEEKPTPDKNVHEFEVTPDKYTVTQTPPEGYKAPGPFTLTVKDDGTVEKDGEIIDATKPIVIVDIEEDDGKPDKIDFDEDDYDEADYGGNDYEKSDSDKSNLKTGRPSDGGNETVNKGSGSSATADDENNPGTSPRTGDTGNIALWLSLMAMCVVVAAAGLRKFRR